MIAVLLCRRVVAFSLRVAGLALCLSVVLPFRLHAADTVSIPKDLYVLGEKIPVTYRFEKVPGLHSIGGYVSRGGDWSVGGIGVNVHAIARTSVFEDGFVPDGDAALSGTVFLDTRELLDLGEGDAMRDVFVSFHVTGTFRPLSSDPDARAFEPPVPFFKKTILIVNDVRPVDGAVRLRGGPVFKSGETISVEVDVAALKLPRSLHLSWFKKSTRLKGGAVIEDTWTGEGPNGPASWVQIDPDQNVYEIKAPSVPGKYSLRLLNRHDFVIDEAGFEVVLSFPVLTLALDASAPLDTGRAYVLSAEPEAFPPFMHTLTFYLRRKTRHGAWAEATYADLGNFWAGDPVSSMTVRPIRGAAHEVLALWDDRFVAGRHFFEAAGPYRNERFETDPLSLNGEAFFEAGEPIDAYLLVKALVGENDFRLRLYPNPLGEGALPPRHEDADRPAIMEWEITKDEVIRLPQNLAPGDYQLVLYQSSDYSGSEFVSSFKRFHVYPPEGQARLEVNHGGSVYQEMPVTVSFDLPDVYWTDVDGMRVPDPRLWLTLVHLGGELPGCVEMIEWPVNRQPLTAAKEGRIVIEEANLEPGRYEARLMLGRFPSDMGRTWPEAVTLATHSFDVTVPSVPGALKLETGPTAEIDSDIAVRIDVPSEWEVYTKEELRETLYNGSLKLALVRLGEVTYRGAKRYDRVITTKTNILKGDRIILKAPVVPGAYAVRLYQQRNACLLGECYDVLIDQVPLTLTDPLRPRLVSFDGERPRALPGPMAGVFPPLGPVGSCGDPDWLPLPEDLETLRLVQNVEGKFVPLTPPIDYGEGFYLEARTRTKPKLPLYGINFAVGDSGETGLITVAPTKEDPKVLRSERLYALWPRAGEK